MTWGLGNWWPPNMVPNVFMYIEPPLFPIQIARHTVSPVLDAPYRVWGNLMALTYWKIMQHQHVLNAIGCFHFILISYHIYRYIWYTYDIHTIYIWYTYDIHMIYIWYTYDIHMIYIWYTYDIHMIYIWYTYDMHMIYIWYTYNV